jgi:hypothetical protein
MLNPDGAERVQRHTAVGIDMNRDAKSLRTPEGRFLRDVRRRIRPHFGFNLHDQAISTVGRTSELAAIALLAPAPDAGEGPNEARRRAMHVGALFVKSVTPFARGLLASYDDAHEPRAFGDAMQRWGVSTLLVESGHFRGDPEKWFIRRLNFAGILSSIHGIADGSYRNEPVGIYKKLPTNGKRGFDLIIRNVVATHGPRWRKRVAVGLEAKPGRGGYADRFFIREVGDLDGFGFVLRRNSKGARIPSARLRIDRRMTRPELERLFRVRL